MQALIYLESIQSLPKQIDYIDSLVEKFIATGPDHADAASVLEREELSNIYLEVTSWFFQIYAFLVCEDRLVIFLNNVVSLLLD